MCSVQVNVRPWCKCSIIPLHTSPTTRTNTLPLIGFREVKVAAITSRVITESGQLVSVYCVPNSNKHGDSKLLYRQWLNDAFCHRDSHTRNSLGFAPVITERHTSNNNFTAHHVVWQCMCHIRRDVTAVSSREPSPVWPVTWRLLYLHGRLNWFPVYVVDIGS